VATRIQRLHNSTGLLSTVDEHNFRAPATALTSVAARENHQRTAAMFLARAAEHMSLNHAEALPQLDETEMTFSAV
jgi:hypothetical protein